MYIHESLADEIKKYLKANHTIKHNSRLFPVYVETVRKTMKKAASCANVKQIKVHDLRHSHASLLINMNVTPLLVSERLGHEKVETTLNVYSHLYPDSQKKLAKALETTSEEVALNIENLKLKF